MRMRVVSSLVLAAAALGATAAPAQIMSGRRNQPGPRDPTLPLDTNVTSDYRPTFRTKVTRIEVSALVVDGEGEPVRDLQAREVEVYDGGRRQEVLSFAAYTYYGGAIPLDAADSPTHPTAQAALVTNAWSSSSRVIALLIDDLHIDARRTERTRQIARHLVSRLAPSDLLYVSLTSSAAASTGAFTRDRRRALDIIDSFGGLRLPDPTLEMRQTPQTFSDPLVQGTRTPGLAASEQQRAMRLEDAYQAIGRIATAVREVGGRRKSLLFLTEGSSVGGAVTTAGTASADTTGALVDAIASASVADLAVYPLNPAGLDVPTDRLIEGFTRSVDIASEANTRGFGGREIAHEDLTGVLTQFMQSRTQLRDLAALTGGVSLVDGNDAGKGIERLLRDASDYYVISYEPDREVKGTRMRPIEVRVTRPGVKVFARKGYMAPPALSEPTMKVPSQVSPAMRTLLGGVVPTDALPMFVQLITLGQHAGKVRYAVVTETAGGPLIDGLGGNQLGIEQAIVSIDASGTLANATQKKATLRVGPAQVQAVGALGLRTIWCVDLAPGMHQLRVATVHEESGRGGSMFLEVMVDAAQPPNAAALLALARAPKPTAFVDPEVQRLIAGRDK